MNRYRTIKKAAEYFREKDPGTAISEYRIRQLILSGKVPASRAGKKYLISIEALEEYFSHPPEVSSVPSRAKRQFTIA